MHPLLLFQAYGMCFCVHNPLFTPPFYSCFVQTTLKKRTEMLPAFTVFTAITVFIAFTVWVAKTAITVFRVWVARTARTAKAADTVEAAATAS